MATKTIHLEGGPLGGTRTKIDGSQWRYLASVIPKRLAPVAAHVEFGDQVLVRDMETGETRGQYIEYEEHVYEQTCRRAADGAWIFKHTGSRDILDEEWSAAERRKLGGDDG